MSEYKDPEWKYWAHATVIGFLLVAAVYVAASTGIS